MTKRKIILLSLIFVFALIYIFQLIFTGKTKVKVYSLQDEITSLTYFSGTDEANSITVKKENGSWVCGNENFKADEDKVLELLNAAKEIKIIGVATKNLGDSERYGLTGESLITVKAFNGEKLIRTVCIGKNTSTNSQCYIRFENKNEISLAQNALHSTFSKSVNDLRSLNVFAMEKDFVTSVKISSGSESYTIVKNAPSVNGQIESTLWSLAENTTKTNLALDDEKINSWISGIVKLEASSWLDAENENVKKTPDWTAEITSGSVTNKINLYNDGDEIYATCTATPYPFKIAKYVGSRYEKDLKDLCKQ